ncbi:MAG: WecB/TagA/CpsF family glycosyltransferase [Firmicutes bacterium]|nr:WecB/TagA/CpsF family glycosyltransferase [Bacillota bacterium]
MERVNILGLPVDKVNMVGAVAHIRDFISTYRTFQVITLNSEMAMTAQDDSTLHHIISKADLVVPDGAGIVLASRILGNPLPERVAGFDLMQELLADAACHKWPVFFLGAKPGVADKAVECIMTRFPGLVVAGVHHGFFSEEEEAGIIREINSKKARLVFVGMGVSKQDYWIAKHKTQIKAAICMGVGGSFDVLAGNVKRAPGWMGRYGLEWLFRLACEPSRLLRMRALPKFIIKVFQEKLA